jgi:HEPN domain-containing protein
MYDNLCLTKKIKIMVKKAIEGSILRLSGTLPEKDLEKELINAISKNTESFQEALIRLIMFVSGNWAVFSNRQRAEKLAKELVHEFKKEYENSEDWEEIASLAVIAVFFAEPKLVATAMIRISLKKEEA